MRHVRTFQPSLEMRDPDSDSVPVCAIIQAQEMASMETAESRKQAKEMGRQIAREFGVSRFVRVGTLVTV